LPAIGSERAQGVAGRVEKLRCGKLLIIPAGRQKADHLKPRKSVSHTFPDNKYPHI
jgi:hypothetical protein